MAHDAKREDYQRLGLRFIRELDASSTLSAMRAYADFGRRFSQERDTLPQTDADRAFHLVAEASEVVDQKLPFVAGEEAQRLIARGKSLLDEALALDPDCFDALRMRSSTDRPGASNRLAYLKELEPRVRKTCEEAREAALDADGPDRASLGCELAMRPYFRWLASMADEALVAGRNRQAVEFCQRLLDADPQDISDVRFTLALAYAKLEDGAALDALAERYRELSPTRPANDAWMGIARIALAHRAHHMDDARALLAKLLYDYPGCAVALIRQNELPGGEFARLHVRPYSEDEMVVALSEAVVLLQEGNDRTGRGVLGTWVAQETGHMDPAAVAEARAIDEQVKAKFGIDPAAGPTGSAGFGGGAQA